MGCSNQHSSSHQRNRFKDRFQSGQKSESKTAGVQSGCCDLSWFNTEGDTLILWAPDRALQKQLVSWLLGRCHVLRGRLKHGEGRDGESPGETDSPNDLAWQMSRKHVFAVLNDSENSRFICNNGVTQLLRAVIIMKICLHRNLDD